METEDTNGIIDFPSTPPPQPVGIYGWRKRCVYAFLLILMVAVVANIALTVWILRVLHFSIDGIGRLKVVPKGFQLKGEAEFTRPIYVEKIKLKRGHPLYVNSEEGVQLLTTDTFRNVTSSFVVDPEGIQATCDVFKVNDRNGRAQFAVKDGKVIVSPQDVRTSGQITFSASIKTPTVMSPLGENLLIQSPNGSVIVYGLGVSIKSHNGSVTLEAGSNIFITSRNQGIHLKSGNIYLRSLPQPSNPLPLYTNSTLPKVFQLCLCENGRLFLASASDKCIGTASICL